MSPKFRKIYTLKQNRYLAAGPDDNARGRCEDRFAFPQTHVRRGSQVQVHFPNDRLDVERSIGSDLCGSLHQVDNQVRAQQHSGLCPQNLLIHGLRRLDMYLHLDRHQCLKLRYRHANLTIRDVYCRQVLDENHIPLLIEDLHLKLLETAGNGIVDPVGRLNRNTEIGGGLPFHGSGRNRIGVNLARSFVLFPLGKLRFGKNRENCKG